MQETQAGEAAAAFPSLGFSSFPAVPLAFFRQFHHIMSIMWCHARFWGRKGNQVFSGKIEDPGKLITLEMEDEQ